MKKLAATIVLALLALGLSAPAFARDHRWDRRHRDWREEQHYRPYPYYRPYPQIIIPFPLPFPWIEIYPTPPTVPACQQVWIQPQWVWDVLSSQWVFDPGHWQTVCQ